MARLFHFKQLIFSTEIKRQAKLSYDQANGNKDIKDSLEKVVAKDKKFKTLKDVEVVTKKKSAIEKFNDEYSSGLFIDMSERVIDCLDNSDILSYPDCISYLQGRVAGLMVSYNEGEMIVKWRGKEMKENNNSSQWLFTVKGYAPVIHVLFENK